MTTPLGQVTGELQDVREWATFGSYADIPDISATKKYTGNYSCRFGNNDKGVGLQFSSRASLRAGYWLNHIGLYASGASARAALFMLGNNQNAPIVLWKKNGDSVGIAVGNIVVAVAVAPAALSAIDSWVHLGLTYISGVGGGMTFWVNGLPALSYVSDSLPAVLALYCAACYGYTSTTGTDPLTVGSVPTGGLSAFTSYAHLDDLYVDADIDNLNEAPPPDRFLFSLASTAGSTSQWTPTGAATNVECVDEAVPDNDTTYVKAEDAGLVDLYETADITLPTDYGIVSAIPIALVKKMADGPTLKLVASDGVSTLLESAEKTPGVSYAYAWESMPLAPDGSPWLTAARVNATQFGVKSTGVYA